MSGDHGSIVRGRMSEDGPFFPRQYVPPGGVPTVDADPPTDEQYEQLRAAWERFGHPRLLAPLPRRVRFRLWCERRIDRAAIALVNAGHYRAAERLWRAFGLWRL